MTPESPDSNSFRSDPTQTLAAGRIIREPAGAGPGYWAGAPGVFYEREEKAFYLTYRIRRPRGVEPDRGGEARIARSTDLQNFDDLWSVRKEQFATASIERCAVRKGADGQWRYFACFVDPADGRWCVSVIKAPRVAQLDPAKTKSLFKGPDLGLEGVKDPWIYEDGGRYLMILSVAVKTPKTRAESHSTLDIFNTGECVSATGLAVSTDLDHWDWQGVVFAPNEPGWDAYCRRINSVVPLDLPNGPDTPIPSFSSVSRDSGTPPSARTKSAPTYLAFYDGSAGHEENYEEKTGLAISHHWREWKSLTRKGPRLTSPHASKSLRYLDALNVSGQLHVFYEFARPDGAHDLRLCTLKAGENWFDASAAF